MVVICRVVLAATSGVLAFGLHSAGRSTPAPQHDAFQFREIGARAGIKGVTVCGRRAKSAIIESNGTGVCWFDYNNDGLLDLYVVNGSTLEYLKPDVAGANSPYHNYLYKNTGNGSFIDVTKEAGVGGFRWGTGCAVADIDNDGWVDLLVTNVGRNFLYRNNGNGAFTDIAEKAGVAGGFDWHTGATFGDYDGDGYLDLYVAGYLDPSQMLSPLRQSTWRGMQVFFGPKEMKGAPDRLYRNNGNTTFTDVTSQAGVEDHDLLNGLTASFEDFDNDGKPDLFVANVVGRNYLYHNLGDGKFAEVGEAWGIAYPVEGRAQSNMGVAIGDYDHNGWMDVFVTTFADEHSTLYHNTGKRMFLDVSGETGLAAPTTPYLGWGAFFADLDNDGWLDLFSANGHVYPEADRINDAASRFAQRVLLFRQATPGVFTEVAARSGLASVPVYSSRGAAYADFDNDGDLDIVYTNLDAPPTLLENLSSSAQHWITIKTVGVRSNRDGIGARIKLTSGGLVQYASVRSGESYVSCNDPRVHFGLGRNNSVDQLQVRWPSGHIDNVDRPPADKIITVEEGRGIVK
jgi:hypothetical protein